MRFRRILALAAFFLPTASAGAQSFCTSYMGEPVPYFADFNLPDVGRAARDQFGRPFIVMNPGILSRLPRLVQSFWLYHECAHHALPPGMSNEVNADCYAVRHLRNTGQINSPAELNDLLLLISQLSGSPFGHLPGPARAQNLWNCISF